MKEQLRQLVAKWRQEADLAWDDAYTHLTGCADELEKVLEANE